MVFSVILEIMLIFIAELAIPHSCSSLSFFSFVLVFFYLNFITLNLKIRLKTNLKLTVKTNELFTVKSKINTFKVAESNRYVLIVQVLSLQIFRLN